MKYYPSDEVLLQLDRFAHRCQQQHPDATQALEFIRTLLDAISKTRHHKKKERDRRKDSSVGASLTRDASGKRGDPSDSTKKTASPASDTSRKGKKLRKATAGATARGLKSRIVEIRRGWLVPNFVLARTRWGRTTLKIHPATSSSTPDGRKHVSTAAEAAARISSSVASHPFFGSHLDLSSVESDKDVFLVHDEDSIRDRIATVGMSKKKSVMPSVCRFDFI